MAKTEMLSCDFERLKELLKLRGIQHNDAAETLGLSRGYFSNCNTRKTISKPVALAIEERWKIKPKDYAVKEPAPIEQKKNNYAVGDFVNHKTFGDGFVCRVENDKNVVAVKFMDGCVRRLSALMAPMKRIEFKKQPVTVDIDKIESALITAIHVAINEAKKEVFISEQTVSDEKTL